MVSLKSNRHGVRSNGVTPEMTAYTNMQTHAQAYKAVYRNKRNAALYCRIHTHDMRVYMEVQLPVDAPEQGVGAFNSGHACRTPCSAGKHQFLVTLQSTAKYQMLTCPDKRSNIQSFSAYDLEAVSSHA